MKKLLFYTLMMISLFAPFAFSGSAAAVTIVPQCNGSLGSQDNSVCPDISTGRSTNPVINIVKAVIEVVSWVTGVASVILIIISGIRFVTSGGDSAKVASAKGAIINAIIGITITILAQTIIVFVLDKVNS